MHAIRLLPLALGLGAGSELPRPLALAVIGETGLSTPLRSSQCPHCSLRSAARTTHYPSGHEVFMHIPQRLMGLLASFALPAMGSTQTLETETARFHPAHYFQIASGFEQQFRRGRESALPVALEYAVGNTWELLWSPSPTPHPAEDQARGTGAGDLKLTLITELAPTIRSTAVASAAE